MPRPAAWPWTWRRELGRVVPVSLAGYEAPGPLADAAQAGAWDIAFLGARPARAEQIVFSAAYVEIEATYLVPASRARRGGGPAGAAHLDLRGAYDLYLTPRLSTSSWCASPVWTRPTSSWSTGKFDALAGLRPRLIKDVEKLPARILRGASAIGTPGARRRRGRLSARVRRGHRSPQAWWPRPTTTVSA